MGGEGGGRVKTSREEVCRESGSTTDPSPARVIQAS